MLLKELRKDSRPGNRGIEKPLHRPVTAAFASPPGDTQHRHTTGHTQHGLDDPTHASQIRG